MLLFNLTAIKILCKSFLSKIIYIHFMTVHDEIEDLVAFASPNCEILYVIYNQLAHLDRKRTQQIHVTWMIWLQKHTTMINDWNLDTLTNLDANIAHQIWILPKRGARLQWKDVQIKIWSFFSDFYVRAHLLATALHINTTDERIHS